MLEEVRCPHLPMRGRVTSFPIARLRRPDRGALDFVRPPAVAAMVTGAPEPARRQSMTRRLRAGG